MASTVAEEPSSLRLNSGKLSPPAALRIRLAHRDTRYFSSPRTTYREESCPWDSWRFSSVSLMAPINSPS